MCFITAGLATLGISAATAGEIGAGITAGSTVLGGISQAGAMSYQAQVARNNATIMNQNATSATEAGQEQAQQTSFKNAAQAGAIKASEAANGVDVNSGSALDVQKSQRETGELDAATVLHNAQLQAYGYRSQATADTAQAQLDTAESEEAIPGALLSASGGLLSSASALSSKYTGGGSIAGSKYPTPTYSG